MSLSREEIYVRQVFSTLLSAANERKSKEGYEVLRSAHAFAPSSSGDASCYGWAEKTRKAKQENSLTRYPFSAAFYITIRTKYRDEVVVHMAKKRSRLRLIVAVALVIVIVLALVIFLVAQATPQGVVPGVKVGDEFVYDIKGFWSSDDPNASITYYFIQLNMTESYKITVTDVNGSKVTISTTWSFTNGTEFTGTNTVNVDTGAVYPSDAFWAIYAANLKENDRARPSGGNQATINETTTRDYASGMRETNLVSLTEQYTDANDPTGTRTWTEIMNTKFDKQTGVLVEFRDISLYTNPSITTNIAWTLKESNVWDV